MNKVLTINEVAEIFRVNRETIYRMVRKGELPAIKLGKAIRIRTADVEKILDGGCINETSEVE